MPPFPTRRSKLLVTGGAGFIGSAFVRWILQSGQDLQVTVLDKLTYAGDPSTLESVAADSRLELVKGDILDGVLVHGLLDRVRPDAIVHFAAESHVDRSIEAPAQFVLTNVVGTCQLLDAALEFRRSQGGAAKLRFLHVSTDEVYGSLPSENRFHESTPYDPSSPYAASKASSDHFVRAYGKTFGLDVCVTHCSNNYGPYQFPEKLIPLMILNALEEKPLPVYGDGYQVRDWIHVNDHCAGLFRVLESGMPGETYNLGGDTERTNLEVVQRIADEVDRATGSPVGVRRQLIQFVADRPGHDRRYALDSRKARNALNWAPQIEFDQGLRETVRWYLEHRPWVQRMHEKYQRQRLGILE